MGLEFNLQSISIGGMHSFHKSCHHLNCSGSGALMLCRTPQAFFVLVYIWSQPPRESCKVHPIVSLVTDEISICCSWWTSEPNKASRTEPHRNTIVDVHQSEQHVSLHLTEHIPLWWMFLFKGIVCYSSCCSLVYWLRAWCLIPTYVICLCLMFMIYSVKLFPLKKLNSKSYPRSCPSPSVFFFCSEILHCGKTQKKKKTEIFWRIILPQELRNSWFFEEMLSCFHCPHESLTTFFSVWIKNWAIF